MKVLWLSNIVFSDEKPTATGTWLQALAENLVASGKLILGNISSSNLSEVIRRDQGDIKQWILPASGSVRHGDLSPGILRYMDRVLSEFSPDLIHVWGTEDFWGLLPARGKIEVPSLLEMQGVKEACSRVFPGGLSIKEQRSCIGFKEYLKRRSIESEGKKFREWGNFEREIIAGHRFITTQSPWAEAWVKAINSACRIFHAELMLRAPFYHAEPWRGASEQQTIFCTAAYPAPFKGIHDAVRALGLLKDQFPDLRLRIAGQHQSRGIRRDGYVVWIKKLARSLRIESRIDWLGPLTADQIIRELQNCSLMLLPSHFESYSVSLAEAMYLGVPVVTSYTGGSAWLARDEESALFFPPGDEAMCAWQIGRLLTDDSLAVRVAHKARSTAFERNQPGEIVRNQLETYREIIALGSGGEGR